jgi:hypothetical protein
MDTILFNPDTSVRRALILALGTYGIAGISPAERDPIIARLLDLYQTDPDAGIHGAAEWTLRQWKQEEKLKSSQAELIKLKDNGPRRWFVNSRAQTFAVIDGPVEFRMGSPIDEPGRDADETPHAEAIRYRFAIAGTEVTVEQFQRFVEDGNSKHRVVKGHLDTYRPAVDGPMIAVSWFGAAAYCNWLSQREGLPDDQLCYVPNKDKEYEAGMTIPADFFKRTGYRLPTEAE